MYVKKHHMFTRPLQHQIKLYNIDGSPNSAGHITHSVRLLTSVDGNPPQLLEYLVTNLGTEDIILGLPWLRQVNPDINWKDGRIMVNTEGTPGMTIKDELTDLPPKIDEHPIPLSDPDTDEDPIDPEIPPSADPPLYRLNGNRRRRRAWLHAGIVETTTNKLWCAAGYTYSQQLAEEAHKSKPQKTLNKMIPKHYQHHAWVFSEQESE